ncbi:hypothetical protein [Bacillus mycoides]
MLFLFKGSIMDIIPAEKLDLKEIKDIIFEWNQEQMKKKQMSQIK